MWWARISSPPATPAAKTAFRHRLFAQALPESATVTTEIQDLVSGATPPTLANPDQITAPGVAITRQVIKRSV